MWFFFFPVASGFFAQSSNGISCFAIVTAIFTANPKQNVLNQFNTQTTLHRHYRDGILSSIKMIHSLFQSYTTNNSQQSPLLQNMKQISEAVPLMLEIYSIAFTTAYSGKDWRSVFEICSTTHLVFTKRRVIICHVRKEMHCLKHYALQGENPTLKSMFKVYLDNNSSHS